MIVRLSILVFSWILFSFFGLKPAYASPILVSFTYSGFGAGAPQDPISGSIIYDAASTTSKMNSLTSISLTIAGHAFSVAEVGFLNQTSFGNDSILIGGLLNGVNGLRAASNDFIVSWTWTGGNFKPGTFQYTTQLSGKFWGWSPVGTLKDFQVKDFQASDAQDASIPEPGSLTLLGAGMLMLWSVRKGRRNTLAMRAHNPS